jgi:preprotein translocase subunit SecF
MGKFSRYGNHLYTGERSLDFVGRRGLWYTISGLIVAACVAIIALKGFSFGIEFTGGVQYRVDQLSAAKSGQASADKVRDAIANAGIKDAGVPIVTTSGSDAIVAQVEPLTNEQGTELRQVIQETLDVRPGQISQDEIGASWGREVAQKAVFGVCFFLLLVIAFIWIYFREWKMSVAGVVALFHDVLITMGVYSLSGFPVTPSAVTGLLAILGFSMYDTVVVFDKVRENTHELLKPGQSYRDAANLAVNQTLVRSINTSIVALIPIGAILYVSAVMLGSSSLQDLALAQFVGMGVGVFSSVFVAPRLLVHMKEGEADIQLQDRRARARQKRNADPYANVPVFTDDMPIASDPEAPVSASSPAPSDSAAGGQGAPFRAPSSRPTALGSGRVVPESKSPVRRSGASGRNQPSRKPRSRRGK